MTIRKSDTTGWWLGGGLFLFTLFLYLLRGIMMPFVIASGLAYIVSPWVSWLERRLGLRRWLVVLGFYLMIVGPLVMAGVWRGPVWLNNAEALLTNAPQVVDNLTVRIFGGEHVQILGQTLKADVLVQHLLNSLGNYLGKPEDMMHLAGASFRLAIGVLLTLVVLAYFLIDDGSILLALLRLLPVGKRPRVRFFAEQIDRVLGRYLRGLLVVVIYAAITAWLGLRLLFHLPYAVPLALATGILEPVPVIGPLAGWAIAAVAGLLHGGIWLMLEIMAFYGLLRVVLDNLIAPIVLGRAVTMHPVAIIFAFLAGGTLLGMLGLLLAIPVAASLKVIIDNWDGGLGEE